MVLSIIAGSRRQLSHLLTALFLFLAIAGSSAITSAADILSGAKLERAGLTIDWFTQIGVGASSPVVDMQLQINEDITTRIFLIEYDGRTERVSQNELDAFGKPRGIEGAEQYANVRREVIQAELVAQRRPQVEVKIRAISLPKSTIYAVDAGGLTSAIDADSGNLLWQTAVGDRRHPTIGLGASKDHVAVVNGSTVYCLLANNGRVIWSRSCLNSSEAPPAVGSEAIFVPLINGRLEVFNIMDEGAFAKSLVSYGSSVARPLLTETSVSWATDKGFYSVAPFDSRGVKYRLDSGGSFVAGAAYDAGLIFISTVGGSVFAMEERRGSIIWEFGTGERITDPPFVRAGSVFVISADDKLFRINAETGLPADGWKDPIGGISQFVGTSSDRFYALDSIGRLTSLDLATGARLATIPSRPITFVLPNTESDRLYVGNSRGLLQCLRETGNTFPIFHADEAEQAMAMKEEPIADKKEVQQADPLGQDDPFAEDDDPFAAESKSTDSDDPFASDPDVDAVDEDDPFGSGGDAGADEDDPFGSGGDSGADEDDPFGSGGDSGTGDDPFSGG